MSLVPQPMSKEEGDARLVVIRARAKDAMVQRIRAQQQIENTFHDRRND